MGSLCIEDGGDVYFVGFDEKTGIVSVQLEGLMSVPAVCSKPLLFSAFCFLLEGSCVGCPASTQTLHYGISNLLQHYIPEVKGVKNVAETESALDPLAGKLPPEDEDAGPVVKKDSKDSAESSSSQSSVAPSSSPIPSVPRSPAPGASPSPSSRAKPHERAPDEGRVPYH